MRALVLAIALLGGCGAPCVEDLDLDCAPLYTNLDWSNVHAQTVSPSCAASGCHDDDTPAGGLSLTSPAVAWTQLVSPPSGDARVLAGDAACSPMIKRIEADGSGVMPPGAQLSEAERCVLRLWVAQGANQ